MKRNVSLAQVQLDPAPPPHPSVAASDAVFTVRLPPGATVSIPAGFDPAELTVRLAVVREALA